MNNSRAIFIAVATMTCIAACSSSPNPHSGVTSSINSPSPYIHSPNIQVTEHWAAANPADLFTAEGTFVRAYYEGQLDAEMSGSKLTSYPGFLQAEKTFHSEDFYKLGFPAEQWAGAEDHYITGITNTGDTAAAIICTRSTVQQVGGSPGNSLEIDVLTFRKTGAPPPISQQGHRRSPQWNVYGDWFAIDDHYTPLEGADEKCTMLPPTPNTTTYPGWPDNAPQPTPSPAPTSPSR